MEKKGLTKEIIVNTALEQIEKMDCPLFPCTIWRHPWVYRSHHCIITLKARAI